MTVASITARVTLPHTAKKGEIVPVRAIVRHPMERAVPRKILHTLRVTCAGAEVFRLEMSPGTAANTYVAFTTVAVETGAMVFEWEEDDDATYRREARLVVA